MYGEESLLRARLRSDGVPVGRDRRGALQTRWRGRGRRAAASRACRSSPEAAGARRRRRLRRAKAACFGPVPAFVDASACSRTAEEGSGRRPTWATRSALKASASCRAPMRAGAGRRPRGRDGPGEEAAVEMAKRLSPVGFAVERMVSAAGSVELIFGCRRDPRFGPVLLVGLGGIFTEVMRDTAVALAPADADEIESMLLGLQGSPLSTGARGRAPLPVRCGRGGRCSVVAPCGRASRDRRARGESFAADPVRRGGA